MLWTSHRKGWRIFEDSEDQVHGRWGNRQSGQEVNGMHQEQLCVGINRRVDVESMDTPNLLEWENKDNHQEIQSFPKFLRFVYWLLSPYVIAQYVISPFAIASSRHV